MPPRPVSPFFKYPANGATRDSGRGYSAARAFSNWGRKRFL